MELRQLAVVVVAVGVFCSAALAGAPLGPPRSLVEHGEWAVNFEYGREEMDLKACGKMHEAAIVGGVPVPLPSADVVMQIEDLTANMFFGSLEYGLCDRWEVFLRLGIADAQDDVKHEAFDGGLSFDGDYGFAWGAGTKMTICQHGDWTFGGVVQVTWLYPDESDIEWTNPADSLDTFSGEAELEMRQFQAGIGATLDMDSWFLYGGICWLFMRGDMDFEGSFYDDDVEILREDGTLRLREESEFGFWAGLGCEWRTAICFAEAQILDDYWLVGGGVKVPLP